MMIRIRVHGFKLKKGMRLYFPDGSFYLIENIKNPTKSKSLIKVRQLPSNNKVKG
jgi:hypothetical protein